MNRKTLSSTLLIVFGATVAFAASPRKIAYEQGENIFVADLDGTHTKKVANGALPDISPDGTRIAFNTEGDAKNRPGPERRIAVADGKTALMDVDCGAEHQRKNWDGPQPAIEKFDLGAEKAVRVTGKNDFVWEPVWLSPSEFLCIIQKENEKEPSIYRMSIDGKNPKLLVKHARTPSASLGTP